MDLKEVSNKLGVSVSTIRHWEREFDLEIARDSRNRRKLDDNIIQIFEKIKELRDKDSGMATIRKVIGNDITPRQEGSNTSIKDIQEIVKREIKESISEQTELSEKYAKATYQIGRLEEKVETQVKEIENLQNQIKLLPAPAVIDVLKQENNHLKGSISEQESKFKLLEEKNKKLEKENQNLKMPWWQRFFTTNLS